MYFHIWQIWHFLAMDYAIRNQIFILKFTLGMSIINQNYFCFHLHFGLVSLVGWLFFSYIKACYHNKIRKFYTVTEKLDWQRQQVFYYSWKRSRPCTKRKMYVLEYLLREGVFEDNSDDNAREDLNLSAEKKNERLSSVFL